MSSILDIVPIPVYTREAFPSDKLKEFAQGAGSAVWRAAFDPNTLLHVLGGAAKWGLGGGAAGLLGSYLLSRDKDNEKVRRWALRGLILGALIGAMGGGISGIASTIFPNPVPGTDLSAYRFWRRGAQDPGLTPFERIALTSYYLRRAGARKDDPLYTILTSIPPTEPIKFRSLDVLPLQDVEAKQRFYDAIVKAHEGDPTALIRFLGLEVDKPIFGSEEELLELFKNKRYDASDLFERYTGIPIELPKQTELEKLRKELFPDAASS